MPPRTLASSAARHEAVAVAAVWTEQRVGAFLRRAGARIDCCNEPRSAWTHRAEPDQGVPAPYPHRNHSGNDQARRPYLGAASRHAGADADARGPPGSADVKFVELLS